MADSRHCHRHPDQPSLLHSTGEVSFTYSSPPEFLAVLPAFSLASSKDDPLSFLRKAQWLDYRRLQGNREGNKDWREAVNWGGCIGGGSGASLERLKWYRVLRVGVTRVSQKMELEEMRKRQVRHCQGEEEEGSSRWEKRRNTTVGFKLMNALSCNVFSSVAVSPSFSRHPPTPHPS